MVEGPMTHTPRRIILSIVTLLLINQLPFVSTHAQEPLTAPDIIPEENPDLLIILSPQYQNETALNNAIHSYITAVYHDLGWTTTLITIQNQENDYRHIDALIETSNTNHTLKACIMVGEDLHTALGGDTDSLEQPSTLPWATLGGPTAYTTAEQGIIATPTTIQLCISLLYPPQTLTLEQKTTSLVFAFQKFSTQRHHPLHQPIYVFESSDLNIHSKPIYQHLSDHHPLIYREDGTTQEITTALSTPSSAFFVHGHSNPSGTDCHAQKNTGWFPAQTLDRLHAPLFGADGCYTAGWWSTQQDNNHLDASSDTTYYGAKIFTSTSLQVLALGMLSQNGFSTPVSFMENTMPELLQGKTLAEAMIGDTTIGDTLIIGDPTFHYTL